MVHDYSLRMNRRVNLSTTLFCFCPSNSPWVTPIPSTFLHLERAMLYLKIISPSPCQLSPLHNNTWLCDSLPQNVNLIPVKNLFLFLSFCTLSPFIFSMSYIKTNCMVRPLKIAFLLLSVPPQLDQCLLHLYPLHMNDLPTYPAQAQLVIILIKGAVWGMGLCWFPW